MYAGRRRLARHHVCLVIMLGMMRFATIERADSLAGILNFLATQGSNENPFVVDARVMMPRALDATFSSGELVSVGEDYLDGNRSGRDAVVTLSAVVTREGTVANLELLGDGRDAEPGVARRQRREARRRADGRRVARALRAGDARRASRSPSTWSGSSRIRPCGR